MNKIKYILAILTILSINSYSQWEPASGISGKILTIFVNDNDIYAGRENGGAYYSNNNGSSWTEISNSIAGQTVYCFTAMGNAVYAGTSSGLYKTINKGINWTSHNYGSNRPVTALAIYGYDIFAGNDVAMIYKTTNEGNTWSAFSSAFVGQINSILFYNNNIYVACNKIYVSTNGGANWQIDSPPWIAFAQNFFIYGGTLRVGTTDGGKKSTTPTGGWVTDIPWGNFIYGYAAVGSHIVAGMSNGMFWSTDNGTTWHDPNSAHMPGTYIYSMAQNNEYVFAGTWGGLYKKPASQFIGLINSGTEVPKDFSLSQNYPNPFNPNTNIKFAVPVSSDVKLTVYNQSGQSVAVLVNEKLSAGSYTYNYDASSLSSGVYFYTLKTEGYTETRKFVLLK